MMFNPFYPLDAGLLDAFVARGKLYFVRQTFPRGRGPFEEGVKGYFLISHYDHVVTAQDHYGAIAYDPNRFLYDWNLPAHREKLGIAAGGLRDYRIFAAVFRPDWERQVTVHMKEKVRAYVSRLGWTPRSGEMVDSHYELQFGELYLRLKYGSRQAKIKFEEIEKQA